MLQNYELNLQRYRFFKLKWRFRVTSTDVIVCTARHQHWDDPRTGVWYHLHVVWVSAPEQRNEVLHQCWWSLPPRPHHCQLHHACTGGATDQGGLCSMFIRNDESCCCSNAYLYLYLCPFCIHVCIPVCDCIYICNYIHSCNFVSIFVISLFMTLHPCL